MKARYAHQHGYFLVLAVIFIMVMGVMSSVILFYFANRATLSVAQQQGLKAFYIAESGLEIGTRLLTLPVLSGTPQRLACAALNGTSEITNATLGQGKFTLTAVNSAPIDAVSTLNGAITANATTISVTNASGFAPNGRIVIDRENIDYAAISGNNFVGVTRGVGGTRAASHTSNTGIGQYQCSVDVQAGIPTLTAPSYQRQLRQAVQLQHGWAVGAVNGSNFTLTQWNAPTEEAWTLTSLAGGTNAVNLTGISMLSYADGWAVGEESGNKFIFLHWNGTNWAINTINGACNGQDLEKISMVSSQEGWSTGTSQTIVTF